MRGIGHHWAAVEQVGDCQSPEWQPRARSMPATPHTGKVSQPNPARSTGAPPPRIVFLSHVSAEADRAHQLKDLVEQTFEGHLHVFTSSSSEDLRPGEEWLRTVIVKLTAAEVVLVLCSKRSVRRAWVNFETGFAWRASTPVIPICHMGLTVGTLPLPLAMFQAVALEDAASMTRLLRHIANTLALPLSDAALAMAKARHTRIRAAHASSSGLAKLLAEVESMLGSGALPATEAGDIRQFVRDELDRRNEVWGRRA